MKKERVATDFERLALATMNGPPISAGILGARLWPRRKGRICATQGGGDYAAQMLLGRLKRAGWVQYAPSDGSSLWELTDSGYRIVQEIVNPPRAKKAV